ncbi:hypothetical protein [Halorubrum trueperi]|uniref:DUF1616 domain-containing protein n=1 Tax=Halorubrum trueperi TaxID=2004704 RepID=A0ABD5UF77_9EURY
MNRDYQFEVQYLLTVTIAVTAAIASDFMRPIFDVRIGYLLLIIIALHIVVINHLYALQQMADVRMESEKELDGYSQYTLFTVTLTIPFLILHAIFLYLYSPISVFIVEGLGISYSNFQYMGISSVKMFMAYLLPLLLTMGLTQRFSKEIFRGLRAFRNINFVVVPEKFKIYQSHEFTEPLFIKVENNGDAEVNLGLEFELPSEVVWVSETGEHKNEFSEELEIASGKSKRYNFELQYNGEDRKTSQFEVILTQNGPEKLKTIDVLLKGDT